jgi:hypothetical protein
MLTKFKSQMGSMVLGDPNLLESLTPSVNASLELIFNQGNVPGPGIYHVQKQPNFFWSFYHGTSEGANFTLGWPR